jgi:hypothetical protein
MTPREPSVAKWSEEGLATLFLRLLGVYFSSRALIYGIDMAVRLFITSNKTGLESPLSTYWIHFIYPFLELIFGIYFLFGGRWVFEKLLTPIVRSSQEDTFANNHEDSR